MRVDVEGRRDTRVPQLLLRDLDRHAQVVEQGRVDVAELVPRHPPESSPFGGWLQHIAQQLGLAQRFTAAVPEQEIVGCGAGCAKAMFPEKRRAALPKRRRQ